MFGFHEYPINHFLEQLRAEYLRNGQNVWFMPFYYNTNFLPINALATGNKPNSTDQDADFIVLEQLQSAFLAGTSTFIQFPNMSVRITHEVSGRQLEDKDTALINIFGRGQRPYRVPRPWIIPAKSSWTTTITNLDTAQNFDLRLTYAGVKAIPTPLQ